MKFKLNKIFFFVFVLIFIVVVLALFNQYSYSKKIVTQNFINKHFVYTLRIKDKFKSILNQVQFYFKVMKDENLKKLEILQLLYKNKDFNATYAAKLLNLNSDKSLGHYEVFIIDKNYKIIDASYKPDLGFDLGQFKVYKYILEQVFLGKKKIDISYPHIDSSSMNVKEYFLIRSPDKKYLLQLAYVVDIYKMMKKLYYKTLKDVPNLKNIDVFFVEKYIIHTINFQNRYNKKTPLKDDLKRTYQYIISIGKDLGFTKTEIEKIIKEKKIVSKIIQYMFKTKGNKVYKIDEKNHTLFIYTIIDSIFSNTSDKLILKLSFSTEELLKSIESLKNRFLYILLILVIVIFLVYKFLVLRISTEIEIIVDKMKKNEEVIFKTYIEEIKDLQLKYNEYRNKLISEIEKNKALLEQNKRFIVDTIHQIKTPLSVITLNVDFIKNKITDKEMQEILEEIEAAITMLTNSYEDLSYISGNGIVKYSADEIINVSEVLKERIHFFESLAKANHKKIVSNIEDEIYFKINKIELDRLIDNNLSNAIKYSSKKEIFINLFKEDNKIILRFESFGERIKNPHLIFDKNYREHSHKRGLGIGLNIVKEICKKYNIAYKTYYKDGKNIFEYIFKN